MAKAAPGTWWRAIKPFIRWLIEGRCSTSLVSTGDGVAPIKAKHTNSKDRWIRRIGAIRVILRTVIGVLNEWADVEVMGLIGISNDFLYVKCSGMKRPSVFYDVIQPDKPVG
jgi:hypothetical protein